MRFVSSCAAVILLAAAPAAHAQLPEQTPIDITPAITVRDPQPPTIVFNYGIEDLSLVNTYGGKDETTPGRVIAQEWATLKAVADAGHPSVPFSSYVQVNGERYDLLQFHFHTPSEHAVNGVRTAMEVHFVHINHDHGCSAGERPLLVIGAFINAPNAPNAQGASARAAGGGHELDRLFEGELPRSKSDPAAFVDRVNLAALLPAGAPEMRYEGGLTAPSNACPSFAPLSTQLVTGEFPEAVHWFLYQTPEVASRDAVTKFREIFEEGNARALKSVNGRHVYVQHAR